MSFAVSKKEMLSGYAEIIKHALIKDYNFFCWLEENSNKLLNLNKSILEQAIYKSIIIKLFYVIKDERECLAACAGEPMMQVNHKYYENLTKDKIDKIIRDIEDEK